MPQKKKALGRGLDAILVDNNEQTSGEGGITMMRIGDVEPNADQPRKNFDSSELEMLAESITQYGMIQPITVRAVDGIYQIVTGERRWRAARMAGISEIPVIIITADDKKPPHAPPIRVPNRIGGTGGAPWSGFPCWRRRSCLPPPVILIR